MSQCLFIVSLDIHVQQESDGFTALLIAAGKGDLNCVRELLSPHQHAVTGAPVRNCLRLSCELEMNP